MIEVVVPTPLTKVFPQPDIERVIISKRSLRKHHTITINKVTFTDSELLGVAARKNSIQCQTCGDVLTSVYHYHRVYCSCGKCSIDGGMFELIRDCKGPFKELTKFY